LRTPSGGSRRTDPALLASAALAVAAGVTAVVLSLRPERATDLTRMAAWSATWLSGVDLYDAASLVDYPPWAIVAFSPLAWLAPAWRAPVWVALNVVLLALVARVLAGRLRDHAGPAVAVLGSLLFAAGAGRTLNQFSIAAMACGVAAIFGPARWRGVALGLSLVKPQVGIIFLLVALARREWRTVVIATGVVVALTMVYASAAGTDLVDLPAAYLGALARGQASVAPGQTEIAFWLFPSAPRLAVSAALFALLSLPAIWSGPGARWGFLALASLLSVRHLSYDLVLLLPWLAAQRSGIAWLVAPLMVANPSAVGGLVAPGWPPAAHLDRVILAAVWLAGAAQVAWRRYSGDD
jgi:hypothetical protein